MNIYTVRWTAVGLIAVAGAAGAQTTSQAPATDATERVAGESQLQELVVTAQRRSESVQKIPIAVTALSGENLLQRGASSLEALSQTAPGLNVSEQVGQARLTLRGIGLDNISTGAESSVAFNQDGVFYSRSAAALASFYDVDRVEILRGPQGTLYGRNATGGSVNILTNQPTDTLHGGVNLTLGNFQTANSDAFISGPLADTVSSRLSFQIQHHDGYGRDIVTDDRVDTKDSQAVRGQLLIKPNERVKILVAADYFHENDRSNGYHYLGAAGETAAGAPVTPTSLLLGGAAPSNPRDIGSPRDPSNYAVFYGGRVDVTYLLSDASTLRSLSAYRRADYEVDTSISPFTVDLFPLTVKEQSNQYTQEFQLNIDTDRNKFVSGVFYLHEAILGAEAGPLDLRAVGGPDLLVQGFYGGDRLRTDAAAFYAQDTFSLTDRFRLTLGGRYSWERKSVDDQSAFDFDDLYVPGALPDTPHHVANAHFTKFTPKIGVDYDLAAHTLVYASFSEGFKSGTFNLGSAGPPIQPEKVDAYEVGLKTTSDDARIRSNTAAFFYNYKNLQVGKVEGELVVLENAAAARIYGVEEELTMKPLRDLTLDLNAAWLHARFTRYVTADQARPGGDGVTIDPATGQPAYDLTGNEMAQSPNYTVNLAADYTLHSRYGTTTLRAESNWSDRVYFTAFDRDAVSQPAYSLQNAFITFQPTTGPWRVTVFVKNIADKTLEASANVGTTLVGSPVLGFLLPPRTFGATLSYKF